MERQSGSTLVEWVVVVAILGMVVGVTALYLRPAETPLDTATVLLQGRLRQARHLAMASTAAYRVFSIGTTQVAAEFAPHCSATTWSSDSDLDLDLPSGVTMDPTTWTACFSSRGISQNNETIELTHSDYGSMTVELLLGGTTRIVP